MLSDKKFIVTIGNYGAVVALHNENKILSKIFLEELNDKTKEELRVLFKANKSSEIYILLDTHWHWTRNLPTILWPYFSDSLCNW